MPQLEPPPRPCRKKNPLHLIRKTSLPDLFENAWRRDNGAWFSRIGFNVVGPRKKALRM
jgi:hypothetical protein